MAVDKPADACRHGITSKGKKNQKATITTATTKIIEKKKQVTNRPSQEGQTITFVRIAAGDLSVGC